MLMTASKEAGHFSRIFQLENHMGMAACFASADQAVLNQLRSNPDDIEDFLYPDDGDSEPPNYADLDKAWHCIHFMLNGSAGGTDSPLSLAILGGLPVGEDMGYGPARILDPQAVARIAAALATVDDANFSARYDPEAMQAADVYLADMCVRDGDDALDYLLDNYRDLVAFYEAAAARGDGAILWIS
jgi:hypothetical protein